MTGMYAVCRPVIDKAGRLHRWEPVDGGAGLTLSAARTYRNFMDSTTTESLVVCKPYNQGDDLGVARWLPMRAGQDW